MSRPAMRDPGPPFLERHRIVSVVLTMALLGGIGILNGVLVGRTLAASARLVMDHLNGSA